MESVFGRDDPFLTAKPEPAFYYPTTPKDVDFDEKRTCLSPGMANKDIGTQNGNAFEPDKFLGKSHTLLRDELPTKDCGSTYKDNSGSSFDETWPSTAHVTASPEINPSSNSSKEISSLDSQPSHNLWQQTNNKVNDDSQGTIAAYINRFRNEPPKSRQERSKEAPAEKQTGEFWWVKQPSSFSTPKESDSSFSPPQRMRNSKVLFNKPPISPEHNVWKGRHYSGSDTRKSKIEKSSSSDLVNVSESDSETARIQRRADKLLEISEGTLTSSSTEPNIPSFPHKSFPRSRKQTQPSSIDSLSARSVRPETSAPQKAKLAPEDDILYQWRLARKMEKAKQGGDVFSKLSFMKTNAATTYVDGDVMKEMNRPKFDTVNRIQENKEQDATVDLIEKRNTARESMPDKSFDVLPVKTNNRDSYCQTLSEYKHPKLRDNLMMEYSDTPPHMHTVCDILPCPHIKPKKSEIRKKTNIIEESDDVLIPCCNQANLLNSADVSHPLKMIKPMLADRGNSSDIELFTRSTDIQCENDQENLEAQISDQSSNRTERCVNTNNSRQKYRNSVTVERSKHKQSEMRGTSEMTPVGGERVEKPLEHAEGKSFESYDHDKSEKKMSGFKRKLKVGKQFEHSEGKTSDYRAHEKSKQKLSGSTRKEKDGELFRKPEGKSLDNQEKSKQKLSESKRRKRVEEIQENSNVTIYSDKERPKMRTVIREVISDHLFSSSLTSEDSQISEPQSCAAENENIQEENDAHPQAENAVLNEYESDGEFPDDEILKILRERRENYICSLRDIEKLLENFPGGEL